MGLCLVYISLFMFMLSVIELFGITNITNLTFLLNMVTSGVCYDATRKTEEGSKV